MNIAEIIAAHNALSPEARREHLSDMDASDEAAWWPEQRRLWVFDDKGGELALNVGDDWALSDPVGECEGGSCRL